MLFLDFLLLFMILLCIVYCWIVSRRIQDLQNSRVEFAVMIKELNASIIKAEHNVSEMSELSKVTSQEIKSVVIDANKITSNLTQLTELANDLSKELNQQLQNSNFDVHNNREYLSSNSNSDRVHEKFTTEDLSSSVREQPSYSRSFKKFINKVVTKKGLEASNLDQSGFYSTLRKVNLKGK